MEHITEGLKILSHHKIPFVLEKADPTANGLVKVPDKMVDNLRELGFRVGKEITPEGKVVFYKGKLFGMIMG